MDPLLVSDIEITYATSLLLSLSDDQIRRHIPEFQNLAERIATVTKSNSLSAETIIHTAEENLELVRKFLLKDQTGAIFRSAYEVGNDPRTAVLSLRSGDGGFEVSLLRLLACRFLAIRRRQFFPVDIAKGGIQQRSKSKRMGSGRPFIKAMGLPLTNQTEDGLKRGEKVLQIEDETGVPGISLALLPCLAKFDHLYSDEIRRVPRVFASQPLVLGAAQASEWTQLLRSYQTVYNRHVDLLHSAKEKRKRISSREEDNI